jgi:hypothetical protein
MFPDISTFVGYKYDSEHYSFLVTFCKSGSTYQNAYDISGYPRANSVLCKCIFVLNSKQCREVLDLTTTINVSSGILESVEDLSRLRTTKL